MFIVMSLGDVVLPEDSLLVKTLFEAVGSIHVADEKLLNAVTGLRHVIIVTLRYISMFSIILLDVFL